MLAAGVDIETVRRIGGWANYSELQKYLHPTDEASVSAVESVGGQKPAKSRTFRSRKPRRT